MRMENLIREPYKSSGGVMVESELGEIPKGWSVKELGDIFKFIKGKKPKNISETLEKTQQQYLTIKSYTGSENLYADIEKVVLIKENETVMVMDGASSGKIFFGKKGIVASTIAKINKIDERIDENLLFYILKYNENEIKKHLTGSAIPHTDKEFVYRIKIAIPNRKILKNISEKLKNIRSKIIENNKEIGILSRIRDEVLPKIMNGEIKI